MIEILIDSIGRTRPGSDDPVRLSDTRKLEAETMEEALQILEEEYLHVGGIPKKPKGVFCDDVNGNTHQVGFLKFFWNKDWSHNSKSWWQEDWITFRKVSHDWPDIPKCISAN